MKRVLCFFIAAFYLVVPVLATGESDPVSDPVETVTEEVPVSPEEVPEEVVLEDQEPDSVSDEVSDSTVSSGDDGESVDLIPVAVYDAENPLPVSIVNEDDSYDTFAVTSSDGVVLVIGDDPPADPPFYGSGFVTGESTTLGTVTLYFPNSYNNGYFGVDSNGYLVNVSSSSISGYLEGVYNNSVSVPSFSYPRYRSGSSYDYINLYIIPTQSNMEIATGFSGVVTVDEVLPYVSILLLGVIVVCFMKRS